jgi:hypothetical protein
MSVASDIQHEMRMHCIVICGLSGSSIFSTFLINGTFLEKNVIERKMRCYFLYYFCMKQLLFREELSEMLS